MILMQELNVGTVEVVVTIVSEHEYQYLPLV